MKNAIRKPSNKRTSVRWELETLRSQIPTWKECIFGVMYVMNSEEHQERATNANLAAIISRAICIVIHSIEFLQVVPLELPFLASNFACSSNFSLNRIQCWLSVIVTPYLTLVQGNIPLYWGIMYLIVLAVVVCIVAMGLVSFSFTRSNLYLVTPVVILKKFSLIILEAFFLNILIDLFSFLHCEAFLHRLDSFGMTGPNLSALCESSHFVLLQILAGICLIYLTVTSLFIGFFHHLNNLSLTAHKTVTDGTAEAFHSIYKLLLALFFVFSHTHYVLTNTWIKYTLHYLSLFFLMLIIIWSYAASPITDDFTNRLRIALFATQFVMGTINVLFPKLVNSSDQNLDAIALSILFGTGLACFFLSFLVSNHRKMKIRNEFRRLKKFLMPFFDEHLDDLLDMFKTRLIGWGEAQNEERKEKGGKERKSSFITFPRRLSNKFNAFLGRKTDTDTAQEKEESDTEYSESSLSFFTNASQSFCLSISKKINLMSTQKSKQQVLKSLYESVPSEIKNRILLKVNYTCDLELLLRVVRDEWVDCSQREKLQYKCTFLWILIILSERDDLFSFVNCILCLYSYYVFEDDELCRACLSKGLLLSNNSLSVQYTLYSILKKIQHDKDVKYFETANENQNVVQFFFEDFHRQHDGEHDKKTHTQISITELTSFNKIFNRARTFHGKTVDGILKLVYTNLINDEHVKQNSNPITNAKLFNSTMLALNDAKKYYALLVDKYPTSKLSLDAFQSFENQIFHIQDQVAEHNPQYTIQSRRGSDNNESAIMKHGLSQLERRLSIIKIATIFVYALILLIYGFYNVLPSYILSQSLVLYNYDIQYHSLYMKIMESFNKYSEVIFATYDVDINNTYSKKYIESTILYNFLARNLDSTETDINWFPVNMEVEEDKWIDLNSDKGITNGREFCYVFYTALDSRTKKNDQALGVIWRLEENRFLENLNGDVEKKKMSIKRLSYYIFNQYYNNASTQRYEKMDILEISYFDEQGVVMGYSDYCEYKGMQKNEKKEESSEDCLLKSDLEDLRKSVSLNPFVAMMRNYPDFTSPYFYHKTKIYEGQYILQRWRNKAKQFGLLQGYYMEDVGFILNHLLLDINLFNLDDPKSDAYENRYFYYAPVTIVRDPAKRRLKALDEENEKRRLEETRVKENINSSATAENSVWEEEENEEDKQKEIDIYLRTSLRLYVDQNRFYLSPSRTSNSYGGFVSISWKISGTRNQNIVNDTVKAKSFAKEKQAKESASTYKASALAQRNGKEIEQPIKEHRIAPNSSNTIKNEAAAYILGQHEDADINRMLSKTKKRQLREASTTSSAANKEENNSILSDILKGNKLVLDDKVFGLPYIPKLHQIYAHQESNEYAKRMLQESNIQSNKEEYAQNSISYQKKRKDLVAVEKTAFSDFLSFFSNRLFFQKILNNIQNFQFSLYLHSYVFFPQKIYSGAIDIYFIFLRLLNVLVSQMQSRSISKNLIFQGIKNICQYSLPQVESLYHDEKALSVNAINFYHGILTGYFIVSAVLTLAVLGVFYLVMVFTSRTYMRDNKNMSLNILMELSVEAKKKVLYHVLKVPSFLLDYINGTMVSTIKRFRKRNGDEVDGSYDDEDDSDYEAYNPNPTSNVEDKKRVGYREIPAEANDTIEVAFEKQKNVQLRHTNVVTILAERQPEVTNKESSSSFLGDVATRIAELKNGQANNPKEELFIDHIVDNDISVSNDNPNIPTNVDCRNVQVSLSAASSVILHSHSSSEKDACPLLPPSNALPAPTILAPLSPITPNPPSLLQKIIQLKIFSHIRSSILFKHSVCFAVFFFCYSLIFNSVIKSNFQDWMQRWTFYTHYCNLFISASTLSIRLANIKNLLLEHEIYNARHDDLYLLYTDEEYTQMYDSQLTSLQKDLSIQMTSIDKECLLIKKGYSSFFTSSSLLMPSVDPLLVPGIDSSVYRLCTSEALSWVDNISPIANYSYKSYDLKYITSFHNTMNTFLNEYQSNYFDKTVWHPFESMTNRSTNLTLVHIIFTGLLIIFFVFYLGKSIVLEFRIAHSIFDIIKLLPLNNVEKSSTILHNIKL